MDKLYEKVPKDCLPAEYGGHLPPSEALNGKLHKTVHTCGVTILVTDFLFVTATKQVCLSKQLFF